MVNTRGDGGAPTAASRSSSRTVMSLQHRLQLQQGFSTGIAAVGHDSPHLGQQAVELGRQLQSEGHLGIR